MLFFNTKITSATPLNFCAPARHDTEEGRTTKNAVALDSFIFVSTSHSRIKCFPAARANAVALLVPTHVASRVFFLFHFFSQTRRAVRECKREVPQFRAGAPHDQRTPRTTGTRFFPPPHPREGASLRGGEPSA